MPSHAAIIDHEKQLSNLLAAYDRLERVTARKADWIQLEVAVNRAFIDAVDSAAQRAADSDDARRRQEHMNELVSSRKCIDGRVALATAQEGSQGQSVPSSGSSTQRADAPATIEPAAVVEALGRDRHARSTGRRRPRAGSSKASSPRPCPVQDLAVRATDPVLHSAFDCPGRSARGMRSWGEPERRRLSRWNYAPARSCNPSSSDRETGVDTVSELAQSPSVPPTAWSANCARVTSPEPES